MGHVLHEWKIDTHAKGENDGSRVQNSHSKYASNYTFSTVTKTDWLLIGVGSQFSGSNLSVALIEYR